jgi:hypothetical protein
LYDAGHLASSSGGSLLTVAVGVVLSSGSLDATNISTITVGGDWTNAGSSFIGGTNDAVILSSTSAQTVTSGGSAFDNLVIENTSALGVEFADGFSAVGVFTDTAAGSALTFTQDQNYAAAGVDIAGNVDNLISMESSGGPGTSYVFTVNQSTVEFVTVEGANSTLGNPVSAFGSLDFGDNLNWTFIFGGAGSGTPLDPYQITTCAELQGMSGALGASYILENDIDCSETSTWNGGLGFAPIGDANANFAGTLDGQGYVIINLYINNSDDYAGLFGYASQTSSISNVGLMNAAVAGDDWVGALAGLSAGSISNCYSTGTFSGTGNYVGGLIGENDGSIFASSVSATTSVNSPAGTRIGGLVGWNISIASITYSYAGASVYGNNGLEGGLAGENDGMISGSTVDVEASVSDNTEGSQVGGLAGWNTSSGTIMNSLAVAGVTSNGNAEGGLVGQNDGSVIASTAAASVTNNAYNNYNTQGTQIGGLVGWNTTSANITNSHAAGGVSSLDDYYLGGLAGKMTG